MITSLERRGRRQFVNGVRAKTWTVSTWSVFDNDAELAEWQAYLKEIDATMDRIWLGWNRRWNVNIPLHQGPAEFRRGGQHVRWCIENDVVPQVSLLQGTTIEDAALRPEHKAHIDAILDEIGDIDNVILEAGNEISQSSFSRDVVRYLRSLGLNQLIAVTTGRNGPVQALEDVGADIIAVTPSYVPSKRLILQADSDHGSKQALRQSKIPFFENWLAQDAEHFIIMAAWDDPDLPGIESHLPGLPQTGANNPYSPHAEHVARAIRWCQQNIGNQVVPPVEPPAPPPPDPTPREIPLTSFLLPKQSLMGTRIGRHSYTRIANRIFIVKNTTGDTWDILVALPGGGWGWHATEWASWQDSTSYKPNLNPVQLGPESIPYDPGADPTKLWERTFSREQTLYNIVEGCEVQATLDLTQVHTELWGVYDSDKPGLEGWREPIGGIVPSGTPTIALASYYGSLGPPYPVKEEWLFCEGYAEQQWTRFVWDESLGAYIFDIGGFLHNFPNGPAVAPKFDCDERMLDPSYILPV